MRPERVQLAHEWRLAILLYKEHRGTPSGPFAHRCAPHLQINHRTCDAVILLLHISSAALPLLPCCCCPACCTLPCTCAVSRCQTAAPYHTMVEILTGQLPANFQNEHSPYLSSVGRRVRSPHSRLNCHVAMAFSRHVFICVGALLPQIRCVPVDSLAIQAWSQVAWTRAGLLDSCSCLCFAGTC